MTLRIASVQVIGLLSPVQADPDANFMQGQDVEHRIRYQGTISLYPQIDGRANNGAQFGGDCIYISRPGEKRFPAVQNNLYFW